MRISIIATLVLGLYLSVGVCAQSTADIIPAPPSVEAGSGSFTLDENTTLVAPDKIGKRSAAVLRDTLEKNFGYKLKIEKKPRNNAIVFLRQSVDVQMDELASEAYVLDIKSDGIS